MSEGFVEVYATATGAKQMVPEHYLDHPVLGVGISRTPAGAEQVRLADGPSLDWSMKQLQEHADAHGVEHAGLRSKAEVLAAIEAGPAPTDSTGGGVPATDENPDPNHTPATGDENQE